MRRLALIPLAIAMLLFSPVASALGLGEIEMQSALNQRLDAEIPLRGVLEDDRDRIIVSLASEEAFRQVGLRRPFSLTRLSFEIKQRPGGGDYIHVTSREPIVEPFLSFLIEVDWPEGNLLREYTVLLDPPVFVSDAPEQEPAPAPREEAPSAAETGSMTGADIAPEVEPAVTVEPEPVTDDIDAGVGATEEPVVAEPRRRDGDFEDTPVFLQVEQEEERAEAEARALAEQGTEVEPEPETATTTGYEAAGAEYGPVQRGETLWNIASLLKNDQMTVQQMMLALLRYNPEAFVDDNINRLRQGYVLRIPDAEAVLSLSAQQAVARVREQNALWQEYRRTVRAGTGQAAPQQADAEVATSSAVSGADADLKIVGSEQGTGVGSDQEASATSAGAAQPAEELKLAQERLESARMEKAELQSRVQELEETVGKMERLIELREDQLAKLQAQLQQIEEGADATAAVAEDGEAADEDEAAATEAAGEATGDGDEAAAEAVTEEVMEDAEAGATEADEATTGAESTTNGADESAAAEDAAATTADETAAGADGTQVAEADTAGSAPAADTGGSVTTTRTQPRAADPGILGTVMGTVTGIVDSIGLTVGGVVAGLGAGGLIPEPFLLPVAGAVVVLLLLLIMIAVRRRRSAAAEEEEYTDTMADSVIAAGGDDSESDFSAMVEEGEGPVAAEGDSGLAETLAADETESGEADAEAELMSEAFDLDGLDEADETVSTAAGGSEDETIAEADVYLAYGLHQQAEDLLKLAIDEQPDRLDYRAKLLEAIYADGRSDDFVEQARAMHGKVDRPDSDQNWLRVVAMGKEMAPSEGLFQQEVDESLKPAAGGAAAPPETDLDVGDDDATDLDFSFDDEEMAAEGPADEGGDDAFGETMMLDSAELGDATEAAGTAGTESGAEEDEMDFDLGDIGLDAEAETETGTETAAGETAESESEDEGEIDLGDFDLDESEMATDAESEMPDFGSGEEPVATGDEEADLSDLDLGSLDEEATGSDTSAEEGSDFDFDLSEDDSAGEDAEVDLSDMDLGDLGESEADDASAEPEVLAAGSDEDVSLDDLAADLAGEEEPAAGDDATAAAPSDDADDEYRTMIDLAKAYIDMGDADSARSALEEVVEAGSDEQRNEAKSLLETI